MTGRSRRRFVRYIWHRNVTDRVSYFQIRSRSYFIYTSWRIAVRGRTTIDDHPFSLSLFFTLLSKTKRWKISNSFRRNLRQVEMVRSNRRKRGYANEGRREGRNEMEKKSNRGVEVLVSRGISDRSRSRHGFAATGTKDVSSIWISNLMPRHSSFAYRVIHNRIQMKIT